MECLPRREVRALEDILKYPRGVSLWEVTNVSAPEGSLFCSVDEQIRIRGLQRTNSYEINRARRVGHVPPQYARNCDLMQALSEDKERSCAIPRTRLVEKTTVQTEQRYGYFALEQESTMAVIADIPQQLFQCGCGSDGSLQLEKPWKVQKLKPGLRDGAGAARGSTTRSRGCLLIG